MRRIFEKSTYVVALILVFTAVISCEEDFTDIRTTIIDNSKFTTGSVEVDVEMSNSPIEMVKSGNLSVEPGQYLLGVHASDDYEKIEASIVSQLQILSTFQVVDDENVYVSDTTVVTTIDTVFLRLPYQVALNDDGDEYELDSIIGNQSEAFNLNVYQTNTYLSLLNPNEPAKVNSYNSNDVFEKTGSELNVTKDFKFLPSLTDTLVVNRWLSSGVLATKDTVAYVSSTSSTIPLPFAVIPLKEDKIKELFLDKYESSEFDSQAAFNDYFRGVILEATGDQGSLLSLNFNSTIRPSIEVYYTNTVLVGGTVLDTVYKNDSFILSGLRAATYKMEDKVYPVNDEVVIQGAAGSEATIELFNPDPNDKNSIVKLREQNLLINDASLTVYINQSADITALPYQLYLYKSDEDATNPVYSQIKDVYTEGITSFGGLLKKDTINEIPVQKYTFKITDYVSDILSGEIDESQTLRLKVINSTDLQAVSNTVFTNYNWNPKAVTLFNHSATGEDKKMKFKISYSEEEK